MQQGSPPPSPTILYDRPDHPRRHSAGGNSRSASHSPTSSRRVTLAPPDVAALLRSKRRWWRRSCAPIPTPPRSMRMALMCISVALSAVQANGVYCWPTYGPVVSKAFSLNTTQAATIVVGGILGVYLCAAPVGACVDRFGPRAGSLLSACLSAIGYFSFAAILQAGPDTGNDNTYLAFTACYFAIGAATVGSYFAALTTASLSFPSHPTLSLSLPLALIGLSALFLSSFSSLPVFIDDDGELNATKYIGFLGCLSVGINLFGAMFMRVIQPEPIFADSDSDYDSDDTESDYGNAAGMSSIADLSQSLHLDEHTPLLIGGPEAAREDIEAELAGKGVRWTALGLLHNEGFWAFGLIVAGCIGPSETLIASIGSVVSSLLPPDKAVMFVDAVKAFAAWSPSAVISTATADASGLAIRNKHVFILSIASTIARLFTGFAADWLAPAPIAVPAVPSDDLDAPTHYFVQRDPVRLRRSVFCAICAGLLAAVFAWNAAFLEDESMLWMLSGGVGALYGAIFTLTPAIVSAHFGPTNFGLAWGMVSYFPALGSVIFSYAYAFLAETSTLPDETTTPLAVDQPQCYGRLCFSASFWVAAVGSAIAAVGLVAVGRRWKV